MAKMLKERKDVEESLTWDLTKLFQTEEELLQALKEITDKSQFMEDTYKGKLHQPEIINRCLDDNRELEVQLIHTSSYVELAQSVDYTDAKNQKLYGKTMNIIYEVLSQISFVKSEILLADLSIIEAAADQSSENRNFLLDLLREKEHMLHPDTEKALSALSSTLESPYRVYEQAKLADMNFGTFQAHGKEYPLGYSLWENDYEYDIDSEIRRNAFAAFSKKLAEYQYTTATAYQTQVQKEKTLASLRGFDSVFDYLLFGQKVERELYNRQIDLIMEKLAPHMRKYAALLQKVHHLDKMTYPDLKIAVDPEYDPSVTIEESKKYIEDALAILGEDYLDMVKTAYQDRWIDFAQNKGKSTGGFCASPYGANSYILLSWSEKMAEVFTLAHELGHAGHFKLCNEAQSVYDVNVSTYFVEAPSTINELLMAKHLLKNSEDKRFKRWVLSSMIGHTYYHNFVTHLLEAAYQRKVYEIIDEGGSVQAETLSELKKEVLQQFWGDAVELTSGTELTWMRQPHYYMGLYSYTYSAGLTIATAVSQRIEKEGAPAVADWRKVLAAGSTKTPVELAQMAGVDITTDQPLLDTIAYIGSMIDEIIALTEEITE